MVERQLKQAQQRQILLNIPLVNGTLQPMVLELHIMQEQLILLTQMQHYMLNGVQVQQKALLLLQLHLGQMVLLPEKLLLMRMVALVAQHH